MYKFAVVEDNPQFANTLESYFNRIQKEETDVQIQVTFFPSGEAFLMDYIGNYDAIYLDIMLPGQNGMEIAGKIRQMDSEVILLFVTNMAQYAVNGYAVNALDYILKPLAYPDFKNSTLKVLQRMDKRKGTYVTLTTKEQVYRVSTSSIYYVEVQGHTVSFYTDKGVIAVRGSLKETEASLKDCDFCKCSNCYLVNLRHVTALNKTEATVGPYSIAVSRRSYNAFFKELTDFIGRNQ